MKIIIQKMEPTKHIMWTDKDVYKYKENEICIQIKELRKTDPIQNQNLF